MARRLLTDFVIERAGINGLEPVPSLETLFKDVATIAGRGLVRTVAEKAGINGPEPVPPPERLFRDTASIVGREIARTIAEKAVPRLETIPPEECSSDGGHCEDEEC